MIAIFVIFLSPLIQVLNAEACLPHLTTQHQMASVRDEISTVLIFLLALLTHVVNAVDATYLGCYKDFNGHRDFSHFAIDQDESMTINKCISACKNGNYTLAGVQFATQCFCGNKYGRYGVSFGCEMKCSGNQEEICGGTEANSVYVVEIIESHNYIGCYKDSIQDRDLPIRVFSDKRLVITSCITTCRKFHFLYAAVQSFDCYCGNRYGRHGPSTDCSNKCPGNENEICGGDNANSVYMVENHMGCYQDVSSDHDLPFIPIEFHSAMTIDTCINLCTNRNFAFAGLQYSDQCYCGNEYGKYGLAFGCNVTCTANSHEICGGVYENSVYRVPISLGCWKEGAAERDLEGLTDSNPSMTIEMCIDKCRNYSYAGLQSGSQCFCGNDYGKYGPSTGCQHTCGGSKNYICGGLAANSVFRVSR